MPVWWRLTTKPSITLKDRPFAPTGGTEQSRGPNWCTLVSDADAQFDAVVELKAEEILPQVTWGLAGNGDYR